MQKQGNHEHPPGRMRSHALTTGSHNRNAASHITPSPRRSQKRLPDTRRTCCVSLGLQCASVHVSTEKLRLLIRLINRQQAHPQTTPRIPAVPVSGAWILKQEKMLLWSCRLISCRPLRRMVSMLSLSSSLATRTPGKRPACQRSSAEQDVTPSSESSSDKAMPA